MNSRQTVASKTGALFAMVGAGSALWFTALFLGDDPKVSASDRLGLITLIGGLSAAVLLGFDRGYLRRSTMIASLLGLAFWSLIPLILDGERGGIDAVVYLTQSIGKWT